MRFGAWHEATNMIPVRYNLRNLTVRKTTTAAAVLGLALVVFVFASVQMLANGVTKTLGRSADTNGAVVLRKGATSELESVIEEPSVGLVLADTTLAETSAGPRGVAELVVVVLLEKIGTQGGLSNATIRGLKPEALGFRSSVKLVAGREPNPGADEAMVGKAIAGRFTGLGLDQSFELKKNRPVKVVGIFEDGGSATESEVWTDLETVRTTFRREGLVSSVRVRVPPARFDAFKASIESNRQLNLQVLKESEYYAKQSENTSMFIFAMGMVIAVFFSFGAMLGAMITMHAAVANRQREIGTLRALGFGKASILFSFLLESILLALIGGAIGAAASLGMGLVRFSMVNFSSWSEIVFRFEPTPGILVGSLIFATVMGVLGGLLPAVRAARTSPIDAMRA
jgi:putative ABC transport system permease protein